MLTRRNFLKRTALASTTLALSSCTARRAAAPRSVELNDIQSRLNATRVNRVVRPASLDDVQRAIREARREGRAISVAGGRHAMGGQQFGSDALHLDLTRFSRVLNFDAEHGLIEVQGGIEWPELIDYLAGTQSGNTRPWAIRQKQTGADRLTIAGALSANAHGRGLRFKPMIDDVESFVLIGPDGKARTCSRRENAELFALAIGGYGLFGVIAQVTLRLVLRQKIERIVRLVELRDLLPAVAGRIEQGFLYGDCQYNVDVDSDSLLREGVFSCYRPVPDTTPIPEGKKRLSPEDWAELHYLAHTDRKRGFAAYTEHYLNTSGQVYWSDTHQLSQYADDYHELLDRRLGVTVPGSEMISEFYVTPEALADFAAGVREDFREHHVALMYGTIRFIERDDESFLAWAKDRSVCLLVNVHIDHTNAGVQRAAEDFRRTIDRAIAHHGRYYLTYHRWAARRQVEACYPQFIDFLRLKKKYDPQEVFQSDWYRHYKAMFADKL